MTAVSLRLAWIPRAENALRAHRDRVSHLADNYDSLLMSLARMPQVDDDDSVAIRLASELEPYNDLLGPELLAAIRRPGAFADWLREEAGDIFWADGYNTELGIAEVAVDVFLLAMRHFTATEAIRATIANMAALFAAQKSANATYCIGALFDQLGDDACVKSQLPVVSGPKNIVHHPSPEPPAKRPHSASAGMR
jgi:hypothetical protein